MPKLKIEMYKQQIGHELLARRNSNKKPLERTWDRKPEKKVSWTWVELKITAPVLGWAQQRGPTPAAKMWRPDPEQSLRRTTTENKKDNINVYVYFSLTAAVYFSLSKAVDFFHTLFLSFRRLRIRGKSE